VLGAVLNKLLRVAFTLVKKRMLHRLPYLEPVLVREGIFTDRHQVGRETPIDFLGASEANPPTQHGAPAPLTKSG
jgi:hypothetical protein